jgi:hypothetical protein
MLQCWLPEPNQRPTFQAISLTLQSYLEKTPTTPTGGEPNVAPYHLNGGIEASAYRPARSDQIPRPAAAASGPQHALLSMRDMPAAAERQPSAVDNSYIQITSD